jgi:hypothetical protein
MQFGSIEARARNCLIAGFTLPLGGVYEVVRSGRVGCAHLNVSKAAGHPGGTILPLLFSTCSDREGVAPMSKDGFSAPPLTSTDDRSIHGSRRLVLLSRR